MKIYEYLTAEEMRIREEHYENHLKNLKDCINYIKDASSVVVQLNEQQLSLNNWQEYINCCPMPAAYIPPDIRLFVEKLKYFENSYSEQSSISWLLSTDDRSILTQNLCRKDLTRSTLKHKNKTNFGLEYDKWVDSCLKMIERIDDFLDKGLEISKHGMDKLNDINELRVTLQQQIALFLDRFTYRVLCSEEAYMNSIDAITAEYTYHTDHFQIHIWTLKNVPVDFQQLESSQMIANLHGIKVTLSIPKFMMNLNFTIRALHLNFDHISGSDQVFLQEITEPSASAHFEVRDLTECLNYEWLMQLEMQNRVRNELLQKRKEYEESLLLFEEQEAKIKNKNAKKEDTRGLKIKIPKIVKPTADPNLINNDMFPDIWEDFLEADQKQYESYFNTMFRRLALDSDEINLRKYFILGGIYQLYQVQKPQHYDFNSFNMTWHVDNSKLVINKDLVISSHTKHLQRSSKGFKRGTRTSLSFKMEEFADSNDHKCPWFVLTIQMPEYLCYWGQPVVCQYESVTKVKTTSVASKENEDLSGVETKQLESFKNQTKGQASVYFPPSQKQVLKLQQPSKESLLLSSPSNTQIHLSGEKCPIQERVRDHEGVLNICDFPLNSLLSKPQIRQLERHIMPRMISSFKFKKEIQEDELEAQKGKSKGKTKIGTLVRKRTDTDIEKTTDNKRLFTLEALQNIPERLIPIYTPNEPIRILQLETNIMEPNVSDQDPKTFAQLAKLISFIKWWHKAKVRKIMDLKPFKSRFPLRNKRLKSAEKQKVKAVFSKSSLHSARSSKCRTQLQAKRSSSKITLVDSSESDLNTVTTQAIGDDLPTSTYTRWTTEHIIKSEYNREKHTVVIQTNRLGSFGLAFKRYDHFPFKCWKLEPNSNDQANEVIFTLDTQYVRCVLYVTEKGIRARVTEPITKYIRAPKTYLVIDEPVDNLKQLKKIFREKHLNIFPDTDASLYVENGYFSEKHLPSELHTYNCMAVNCTQIKFMFSHWNCLAQRRDIILKFLQYKDSEKNTVEVRITPEEAFFIEISELCSDNFDIIKLQFNLSWRNINVSST